MPSKDFDIIILTESKYAESFNNTGNNENVLQEDNYVKAALENLNLRVQILAWDDRSFDWNTTKYILFRSIWDYFDRIDEFSIWLNKVCSQTLLLNSERIIRWNIDKHYLLDLEQKGVHIISTVFIEKGSNESLLSLHLKNKWKHTILKPCISGTARHTYKLNMNNLELHESIFQELIASEVMMLQPFQNSIVEKGELSLIVINGKYSHAVLKKAKKGDFRVQNDFGGTVHIYTPTSQEISFAENTVKASIEPPIYARVDITTDNDGYLAVVELELIEPELWFRINPQASNQLAEGIKKLI